MSNGVLIAIFAGISMGAWGFFHDKSVSFMNPVIGATLVSLTAFIFGIMYIYLNKDISFDSLKAVDYKGFYYIILVGIFAFLFDYLTLRSFGTGIKVSVGLPIIIITSIVASASFGILFNGEFISYKYILGILISIIGIYIILLS